MPADGVATLPSDDVLGAPEHELTAATIGKSGGRRTLGLFGQYGLLAVLATIVLAPVALALMQALSPPFDYINAGKPLHPVSVDWKDRTWLTGGPFSVVARTALVALALAWVQLRAAGGTVRHLAALRAPRRIAAVVVGVIVLAVLVSGIWNSAFDRSGTTGWWWAAAFVGVAATQLIGLGVARPVWRPVLVASLASIAVVTFATVAFGTSVWSRGWDQGDLGPAMGRSLSITILITVAQVVTSILAAYAFAQLDFPGRDAIFWVYVSTLMIPAVVTIIPLYSMMTSLGLKNSFAGLVVPFMFGSPYAIFLLRENFRSTPSDVLDAARIDGAGVLRRLWQIMVPMNKPILATLLLITVVSQWNNFMWPLIIAPAPEWNVITVATAALQTQYNGNWTLVMAATTIALAPLVILFLVFQKQITSSLGVTGVR